uniref:LuxR C-terminal-related transcriptional regulator n=1 Tax=Hafnia alvei TaxID=569 RepID=UPI003C6D3621
MPITSEMQKVLRYLSNGYSVKQISCILNKNIKTISTHKRTTMIRLGVKTTMELIVKYRVINILECIMRDCHEIENFDELDKNRSINTLFTC